MAHSEPTTRARLRRRRSAAAFVFLIPALVIFVLFIFYPTIRSVILSFQGSNILGQPSGFVGLKHYQKLFVDPSFGQTLLNTLMFTILTVVPTLAISLFISLMLNQRIGGMKFFRSAFAIPFAFSVATASVAFSIM